MHLLAYVCEHVLVSNKFQRTNVNIMYGRYCKDLPECIMYMYVPTFIATISTDQ